MTERLDKISYSIGRFSMKEKKNGFSRIIDGTPSYWWFRNVQNQPGNISGQLSW